MSGQELGTKHLWLQLDRTGPPAPVSDAYTSGNGVGFGCDFSEGGRDSVPPDATPGMTSLMSRRAFQHDATLAAVPINGATSAVAACPHMAAQRSRQARRRRQTLQQSPESKSALRSATPLRTGAQATFDHCYVLNDSLQFKLSWTLDLDKQLLNCSISAPTAGPNSYLAIGFRPLGRSVDPSLQDKQTGHHTNFGMQGADIVAGSAHGGVRTLYTPLYVGAPVPSSYLELLPQSASAVYSRKDGQTTVTFARPLVSGYLLGVYGINASIVSPDADLIWAIGEDSGPNADDNSTCTYHDNRRGLRFVDWQYPEIALVDMWKC